MTASTSTRTIIRRVTSYDGAVLEESRPNVTDVIPPEVARTMVAMLEDVVQFGTGVRAKELGRPSGGKTGTTNDFTDAWYIGFTPQITSGVWVGNDDSTSSLGKKETGARAALPIWLEFMEQGMQGMPVEDFPNVVPLEKHVRARIRAGGYAGHRASRRRRRAGSRGAARNRTFAITTGGVTIGAKAACCSATPGCGSSAIALDNLVLLFPAKWIPATRIERLAAAIGANECDLPCRVRSRRSR